MKKAVKILSVALVVLIIVSAFAGCTKKQEKLDAKITVTVDIVYKGDTKTVVLNTDKVYLADALVEEGIVEYQKSGMYTTIDGKTADYNEDGGWWYIAKDGEMVNQGLNDIKLADGDKYTIEYTTQWK